MMVNDSVKNLEKKINTIEPTTYSKWYEMENKVGVPYIAFAFKGDEFETHQNLTIGGDEAFDNTYKSRKKRAESGHRNGKLVPGKEYAVALRGYTAEVYIYVAFSPCSYFSFPFVKHKS
jgi:hypothetical protein